MLSVGKALSRTTRGRNGFPCLNPDSDRKLEMSRSLIGSRTAHSVAVLVPFSFPPLLRSSSSVAGDAIGGKGPEPHHPWPEWVSFVDCLKRRGYLSDATETSQHGGGSGSGYGESLYNSLNLLKEPCIKFGRDHRDIFKTLSRRDIKTVVRCGCPNLLQKAVNSAKRLRVYVRLDEADVCGACNLRGSCDRANLVLTESDGAARTVDIVRILLFYALDPLLYGDDKSPGMELVEKSIRKLLAELKMLSEAPPNTVLTQIASQDSAGSEETGNHIEAHKYQDVDMKSGDWICSQCNVMNYARYRRCRECKAVNPKRASAKNTMKKGDWNCLLCRFRNFASKKYCLRCRGLRPARLLEPGEWECPTCDSLIYDGRDFCRRCNAARPGIDEKSLENR